MKSAASPRNAFQHRSGHSQAQVTNVQLVDQKIAQLQQELAIMQTARNAYANALQAELPKES